MTELPSSKRVEMSEVYHAGTIMHAIMAAQEGAAALPLDEYDVEEETAVDHTDTDVDVTSFDLDGFSDFKLDLTCLSTPPSPPASFSSPETSSLPPSPPSPRSVSFASPTPPSTSPQRPIRNLPSPKLSPVTATSLVRGSWPLIRYVGRGTPIDRRRRIEWGGGLGSEEVGEDGMLFSTVRSTSLDSALRPSQRSISPDWNLISPVSSPHASSPLQAQISSRASSLSDYTEAEQIHIDGLNSSPAEWASFMQSVLGSTASGSAPGASPSLPVFVVPDTNSITSATGDADVPTQEVGGSDVGLEIDLGLDAALDLGLGLGRGMNWFDLGLLPASGRASPSVYSSPPPTPHVSRPPSEAGSLARSMTAQSEVKYSAGARSWWQNVLSRLRRFRHLLRSRRGRV